MALTEGTDALTPFSTVNGAGRFDAGSANPAIKGFMMAGRTAGNFNVNSNAAWVPVHTDLIVTIGAAPGDVLEIAPSLIGDAATTTAVLIEGGILNANNGVNRWISGGGNGYAAWMINAGDRFRVTGSLFHTVQLSDIINDVVKVALIYRTSLAANRLVNADTNSPAQLRVVNYGPIAIAAP